MGIFRGSVMAKDVDEQVLIMTNRNAQFFVDWIPHNIKQSICNVGPLGNDIGVSLIGNNTAILEIFQRIQDQFAAMFERKGSSTGTPARAWTRWSSPRPRAT